MKRFFSVVCSVVLVSGFAGVVVAAPYTWVDTFDAFPDEYVGCWDSYEYRHDLTDDSPVPFVIGQDFIYDYSVSVRLYDDGGRWDFGELAYISQPRLLGDQLYDFSYENPTLGWSLAGLIELNFLGGLTVSITSWWGDFYFDSSTLTASGESNAPVPEPATMLLLGSGLIGLAGFGRKRFKKK